MTPELHTPDGLPETPRARAVRAIGDSTELDAGYLAALLHLGDQVARLVDQMPVVVHRLRQATAAAADIARAVERLYPSEEPHE